MSKSVSDEEVFEMRSDPRGTEAGFRSFRKTTRSSLGRFSRLPLRSILAVIVLFSGLYLFLTPYTGNVLTQQAIDDGKARCTKLSAPVPRAPHRRQRNPRA